MVDMVNPDSEGEPLPVSFNADGYRLWERLSECYLEYIKIQREIMEFLEGPRVILSIHSHEARD
eukprot:CAMPEP_0170503448 /NCGR_PEP_ID=MMETSP0208-20121228/44792_1 /TAXON_ID=197538 /ORGANISM="Strombidium inclinatum, Strain S3" /LENGTH=63 /DNA_ID=CAMNT_0010783127 /DNA_START=411 /DNA_END=602 /DNA_ORIENTATION=+